MARLLYVIILFCLTASCSAIELVWDTYTPIQVDSSPQLIHFTTTVTEQFLFDYDTNSECTGLSIVLKYSCGPYNTSCDPYPTCSYDPDLCKFDFAINETSTIFPYANTTTNTNARNSCSCDVTSTSSSLVQNWFALIENSDANICNLTLRVHRGHIQFNLTGYPTLITLSPNSIAQGYLDLPRGNPLQMYFDQGSCGASTYYRYRYTCLDDDSAFCGSFLRYPEKEECTSSSDCNYPYGYCISGTCTCYDPYTGRNCDAFAAKGYASAYANYNSQPFNPSTVYTTPLPRNGCGCNTPNGTERWYFVFYNTNSTYCNVSFVAQSTMDGFEANQLTEETFVGYTTGFQAKYFKFGLSYQVLSISLSQSLTNCYLGVSTHQICGDGGGCFSAPYSGINYDTSTTLVGRVNAFLINTTFLYGANTKPIQTCGCSNSSTTSDVYLALVSTTNAACNFALDVTVKPICSNSAIYDPASRTCICQDGTYGDLCQYKFDSTCHPFTTNAFAQDTCVSLNSSTCLCPVGFGQNYVLPALTFPETEHITKGFIDLTVPFSGSYPQFDALSTLSYKFFNAKNNKELTIRFGHFDAGFPVTLQIVMSRGQEPNIIMKVVRSTTALGYPIYTNSLIYSDLSIISRNVTGNDTITFTDLEPAEYYYFKVSPVGTYNTDPAYRNVTYNYRTDKPSAFAFTLAIEPNDTYAKVVNILLVIAMVIVLIVPCIVVPLYRKKLAGKSILPDSSKIVPRTEKTSLLTKIILILISTALWLGFRLFRAVFNLSILFYSFGRFVDNYFS